MTLKRIRRLLLANLAVTFLCLPSQLLTADAADRALALAFHQNPAANVSPHLHVRVHPFLPPALLTKQTGNVAGCFTDPTEEIQPESASLFIRRLHLRIGGREIRPVFGSAAQLRLAPLTSTALQ